MVPTARQIDFAEETGVALRKTLLISCRLVMIDSQLTSGHFLLKLISPGGSHETR